MEDRKWLQGYAGQSTEELLALAGEYRTDSIVVAFEEALQEKIDQFGEDMLTDEERVVVAIEQFEREVNNGGYTQFFSNSSSAHALMMPELLDRIGCETAAQLTREAFALLGLTTPLSAEVIRQAALECDEALAKALNDCDQRYYESVGDLSGVLFRFIQENRNQIDLQRSEQSLVSCACT